MNKKIIWIVVILIIVLTIIFKSLSSNQKVEEFKPLDKNIGDEFSEISYPNKMYIINYEIADVTGDAENDMIMLVGESNSGDGIANNTISNMDIVIYDKVNNKFLNASSNKMNGMDARIILRDLTGDQILDIIILYKADNNYNLRVFSCEEDKISEIWKERNNKGLLFTGDFLDGFKVKISNKKVNIEKIIDLSKQSAEYIENGLFDKSGKLIKNNKISYSHFTNIEVVELNDRGGIRTVQQIYGLNENDVLDEVGIIWKYNDGKWQMVEANSIRLGNLLY